MIDSGISAVFARYQQEIQYEEAFEDRKLVSIISMLEHTIL